MSAAAIGIIAFLCIIGGAVIGWLIRNILPEHHLSGDSRDGVKMMFGMIATMSALVLGLLVSSAKNTFDDMSNAITESSAKIIMLDRAMAQYGPQTQDIREQLRKLIASRVNMVWPEGKKALPDITSFEKLPPTLEVIAIKLRELTPQNDSQRAYQSEALQLCKEVLQTRWLTIERAQMSLPTVFRVVLLFWFTILAVCIGLLAPPNKTVLAAIVVCAISVGGAIFLIEEMNNPLRGLVKVSNAPLINALKNMGK